MGADGEGKEPIAEDQDEGYKTGTSTPGYRHPDGMSTLARSLPLEVVDQHVPRVPSSGPFIADDQTSMDSQPRTGLETSKL
jgi:hypothetical protein